MQTVFFTRDVNPHDLKRGIQKKAEALISSA
jgi:hypothetical protein